MRENNDQCIRPWPWWVNNEHLANDMLLSLIYYFYVCFAAKQSLLFLRNVASTTLCKFSIINFLIAISEFRYSRDFLKKYIINCNLLLRQS